MRLLSGHARHVELGWSDVSCLECERDRNLHWCVESDIDDIRESLNGFLKYRDPVKGDWKFWSASVQKNG
jgi:hypothetical protein